MIFFQNDKTLQVFEIVLQIGVFIHVPKGDVSYDFKVCDKVVFRAWRD